MAKSGDARQDRASMMSSGASMRPGICPRENDLKIRFLQFLTAGCAALMLGALWSFRPTRNTQTGL